MTSLWLNIVEMLVINCSNFYISLSVWKKGSLVAATYCFSIKKKQIVKALNVNRKVFLKLNFAFCFLVSAQFGGSNSFTDHVCTLYCFFVIPRRWNKVFPCLCCSQSSNTAGTLKECMKIRKHSQFRCLDLVLILRNVHKMQKFLFFIAQ